MDLDARGARVTGGSGFATGVLAENHFRFTVRPALSPAEPDRRLQLSGVLAEAPFDREPARAMAPRMPVGLREAGAKHKTITILLIDNNEIDVIAIRRSFWQLKIPNPIVVARNGLEALDMLRGQNGHEKVQAPYLVLLELNMPRMGGIEFLEELRRDPVLRRTLVLVMTTSTAREDRERAYEKNVAGFVPKPRAGESFTPAISALESYWRAIEFPD